MTPPLMKALRLTASNGAKPCLALTTLPKPSLPPSTVLIKILAAGINPSDVLNANGGFHHTTFPRVPGRDYAGIVTGGPVEFVGREVYGTSGNSLGFSVDGTHARILCRPIRIHHIKAFEPKLCAGRCCRRAFHHRCACASPCYAPAHKMLFWFSVHQVLSGLLLVNWQGIGVVEYLLQPDEIPRM